MQQSQPNALEVLNAFFDAFPRPPEARLRRPPEVNPRLALALAAKHSTTRRYPGFHR
jgi:hypothetical protein